MGICLGNLGIFADLFHIVNTHILNGTGSVFEVLNIEVHHFNSQLLHIGHHILGDLFGNALPVLNHFLQANRTDDFPHIAFQHLGDQAYQILFGHSEQRFRRTVQQLRIGRNLDVGNPVYGHIDEFVCRHCLGGLHIHLHHLQGQFIHPLKEGNPKAGFSDEYPALAHARNNVGSIRRRLRISGNEENQQ